MLKNQIPEKMNDPIGRAIVDFFKYGEAQNIIVNTNYTENETLPPAVFFRRENEMSEIESTALNLCYGKVLDVGAGAGCHSIVLQKKGIDVTALEKSKLAAGVMEKRGVKKIIRCDIFEFDETGYDSIVLLMNGSGIGGTLHGLKELLLRLKNQIVPGGQILMDSADIGYLFEEDDGSVWIDLANDRYFGEMEYRLSYKEESAAFNWLFVDFDTLAALAGKIGLKCERIAESILYEYLARITLA